ncbi:hypothetical protein ACHHYP_12919 [Achlya hypogyna]|uniref:Uncharacterized protein n=1 Tax=Achlya hypogyna TaxID=1202772 RepID=A0A1V9ZG90_ACHHY|nr:hypothetical protein ACHHYP_12919 [Achlya hypogyna]
MIPQVVKTALEAAVADFPGELQEALYNKFTAYYNAPETANVEHVLRKHMTDERAQNLLFTPKAADGQWYAQLVQGPPQGAPATYPHAVVGQRYLAMMYLCHARRWPFAREFILHDGLAVLVSMFDHDDMHMRGQALDTFTQLTSNPDFDWFERPSSMEDKALHHKMLLLLDTAGIVQQVVVNKETPGLSFCALQILAFYMSWVRKLYSKGELRLSSALLATLASWMSSSLDEEAALAAAVHDDFNRWPAADCTGSLSGVELPEEIARLTDARAAFDAGDFARTELLVSEVLGGGNNADALPPAERQRALALCGAAAAASGNLKTAAAYFARALASPPTSAERQSWVLDFARTLESLGLFDRALAALEEHAPLCDDPVAVAAEVAALARRKTSARAVTQDNKEQVASAGTGSDPVWLQALVAALLQRKQASTAASKRVSATPKKSEAKRDLPHEQPNEQPHDDGLCMASKPAKPRATSKARPAKPATTAFTTTTGRKLLKAKASPLAMAKLLTSVQVADFAAALPTVLSADMLEAIFRGLQLSQSAKSSEVSFRPAAAQPLVVALRSP